MRREVGVIAVASAAAAAIVFQSGVLTRDADVAPAPAADAAPVVQEAAPAPPPAEPQVAAPPPGLAAAAEAEIARLTEQLALRQAEIAELEQAVAARDGEVDRLVAELRARGTELARLRAELAELHHRFAFDIQLAALETGAADRAPAELDAALAAAKEPAAARALTAIHFDTGSARLSPGGQAHAAAAAVMLSETPLERVRLVGYADRTGSPELNRRLAEERARSVAEFLIAAGLAADRIETAAMIEADALPVPTDAGVAEPLNRSVAILALPPPTS